MMNIKKIAPIILLSSLLLAGFQLGSMETIYELTKSIIFIEDVDPVAFGDNLEIHQGYNRDLMIFETDERKLYRFSANGDLVWKKTPQEMGVEGCGSCYIGNLTAAASNIYFNYMIETSPPVYKVTSCTYDGICAGSIILKKVHLIDFKGRIWVKNDNTWTAYDFTEKKLGVIEFKEPYIYIGYNFTGTFIKKNRKTGDIYLVSLESGERQFTFYKNGSQISYGPTGWGSGLPSYRDDRMILGVSSGTEPGFRFYKVDMANRKIEEVGTFPSGTDDLIYDTFTKGVIGVDGNVYSADITGSGLDPIMQALMPPINLGVYKWTVTW